MIPDKLVAAAADALNEYDLNDTGLSVLAEAALTSAFAALVDADLGDTHINWLTQSPAEQWRDISELLLQSDEGQS